MTQSEPSRAALVKGRFLREYSIKVVDEWLTGCVTFGMQENPKISNQSLFQFAFDQWLLADLCEVGVSTLPGDDDDGKRVELKGTYAVQLNYLVDISEPCYEQLRNLYNKKLDEADDEIQMRKTQEQRVKKKRMLKLELTDGKKTVIGMEHSPIAALNTKLPPGTKLLLMGPIRCINKVLFLEPQNVRILGGEVDTLLITNAFENVLLRALGKPLNPDPKTEYEEVVVTEKSRNATQSYANIPAVPMVFPSPAKPTAARNDDWEDDMFLGINLEAIEGTAGKPPEQVHSISTLMDDDADLEIINLPEEEIMNHQVTSTKSSQPSPKCAPKHVPQRRLPSFDGPDDDIDAMEALENEIRNEQREHFAPSTPTSVPQQAKRPRIASPQVMPTLSQQPTTSSKNFDDKCSVSGLFDDDDSLEAFDIQPKSPESVESDDILSDHYRFQIEGHSFVTVNQISQLSEADRNERTFVIFGEVLDVFEGIRVKDGQWKLGVKISDRSETMLSVRFHTDVIAKMAGHDATAMAEMKKDRSAGGLQRIHEILVHFKNNLQELHSFMRVQYEKGNDIPFVMELYDFTPPRKAILEAKISREKSTAHLLEVLPPDCDIVKR